MTKERKEAVIPLRGINNRDKGFKMEEGYCSKIMNLAYRNGSWRGVGRFPVTHTFWERNTQEVALLYRHPMLPADEFIGCYRSNISPTTIICHVKLKDEGVTVVKDLAQVNATIAESDLSLTHYANLLYFSYPKSDGTPAELCFMLKESNFTAISLTELTAICGLTVTYDRASSPYTAGSAPGPVVATVVEKGSGLGIDSFDRNFEMLYAGLNVKGYLCGSFLLFAAYRMTDGSVVRNGEMIRISSVTEGTTDTALLYQATTDNTYNYYMEVMGYTATLNVPMSMLYAARNFPFVESIVIYASPCLPEYDFGNIHENFSLPHPQKNTTVYQNKVYNITGGSVIFNKQTLDAADRPFYAIAEINPKSETNTVNLNYPLMKDIENKPIYTPNYSAHDTTSLRKFEFNGKLHGFSLFTKYYEGDAPVISESTIVINGNTLVRFADTTKYLTFIYTLDIDGHEQHVVKHVSYYYYAVSSLMARHLALPNFIAYPDSRARKVTIMVTNLAMTLGHVVTEFNLRAAPSSNYAYYEDNGAERFLGKKLIAIGTATLNTPLPKASTNHHEPNKMTVSKAGNPFVYAPYDIYTVGERGITEIMAANVPTDDRADFNFGNYPIYLFTNSGIFAMQRSSEPSYGIAVLISGDSAQSESTAKLNGVLYYLSPKGVMALSSGSGINISEILLGGGTEGEVAFEEYFPDARLLVAEAYGELLLFNEKYEYAYLYSPQAKVWSTRTMAGRYLGSSLTADDSWVRDISGKEGDILPAAIETQPLSLQWETRKSIEMLEFDMEAAAIYSVKGANEAGEALLRQGYPDSNNKALRLPRSWRSFRIILEGSIERFNAFRIRYGLRYKQ